MKKYITKTEIDEIKAMKSVINYSDLTEIKKILEKNDKKISLNNDNNRKNLYNIYFAKNKNTICQHKVVQHCIEMTPAVNYSTPELSFFKMFFDQVDPEEFRIFMLSKDVINFDFESLKSKLKEFDINDFDTEMFVLNEKYDFDFSPYTIDSLDKNIIKNVSTLSLNVINFFDEITKGLDEETKKECKNNFLETIVYILKNVGRDDITKKDLKFRNLLSFIKK